MFKLRRRTKPPEGASTPPPPLPRPAAGAEPAAAERGRVTTIEINQLLVLRKPESLVEMWCERCGAQGQWIAPDAAALLANEDTRAIYRRVEAGTLHFVEAAAGVPFVCLNSLFN